jgi:aryl-alcohol dehydrogenase
MRTTAAIARTPRTPFSIEELELDEPRPDEVLVRVAAAGLSHTDLLARDGDLPVPLPAVLGREAAGIVERVGTAVTRLAPGDRVVLTLHTAELPPPYGPDPFDLNLSGARPDGSTPLHQRGQPIAGCFFGQSSHATYALATERNAIRIAEDAPFPVLAALGGDAQIGAGAVIDILRPRPGSAVAIFGAGAAGLSAVIAAQLAGCHPIIAVDIKASRLELAEILGATHAIDPDGVDPVDAIRGITGAGAESSIETTGLPGPTRQAIECLGFGGSGALVGLTAAGAEATLDLRQLRRGRMLCGSPFGSGVPAVLVPRLAALYWQRRFPVDRMIAEYGLRDINRAADDLLTGAAVKPVLVMP